MQKKELSAPIIRRLRGKIWDFLVEHLGSRPDEVISSEAQNEGFRVNPFPAGLGPEQLEQLGGIIEGEAKDVKGGT